MGLLDKYSTSHLWHTLEAVKSALLLCLLQTRVASAVVLTRTRLVAAVPAVKRGCGVDCPLFLR
jgi:hypothetical protein